ncbi:hypothetical protein H5410_011575 [Solanum commersonii]|uniref:Uncharacterized protein n=1 Tax=Solanum commersonii TaxID=4109 RepID=A0A9J6AP10_SOLCO|nr:hypothetical protein H5410_011575 [Solanum commersonii]
MSNSMISQLHKDSIARGDLSQNCTFEEDILFLWTLQRRIFGWILSSCWLGEFFIVFSFM